MKLGVQVGLGLDHIVSDGDPAPLPQRSTALQFSTHVCCGQTAGTAGWIKVPLGTKVGLGPGNTVLDADPAPPLPKGTAPPIFGPCLLWAKAGWIKMLLGTKVGLGTGNNCVTLGSSSPPKGAQLPIFGPCLLWPNGHPSQLLLRTLSSLHERYKPTRAQQ